MENIENRLMDMSKGKLVEMITNLTKANIVLSKEVVNQKETLREPEAMSQLKNCPQCGSDDIGIYGSMVTIKIYDNHDKFSVAYYCHDCDEDYEDTAIWKIEGIIIAKIWKMVTGQNNEEIPEMKNASFYNE